MGSKPISSTDDHGLHSSYADFSGGKVWQAAQEFRAAGVSEDLVERLQHWASHTWIAPRVCSTTKT